MTSQTLMITVAFHAHNHVAIFWNTIFIIINMVWITLIIRERRPVQLHDELLALYENHFSIMTPQEFLKFWNSGEEMEFKKDTIIIKESETKHQIMIIITGQALVIKDGKTINTLGVGNFIGEMSYLTQGKATADVVAGDHLKVAVWTRQQLDVLAKSKPSLWHKIQSVIGKDLVKKIVLTSAKVN